MNCPNCGRELAEGEICNCIPQANEVPSAPETAPVMNEQPPVQPQPEVSPVSAPVQNTYYTPPVAPVMQQNQPQQPYFTPQQPVATEIPARTDYPEGYKIKKKHVAVTLAVTVGMFGIHNYYLGNNSKALAQLLVCLLGSLVFGLGAIVAYVWATVEAVLIFAEKNDKDGNGYKIMTFEESLAREINKSKE
ncbi:MAG: NINE protein [Eubacterium sp.]|nr:NINE protein [Eubacterium sp.]